MESVLTLIEKASEVCGGDSALAERIGTARQNVCLMKTGKRSISPATAAELADIAGVDVDYAIKLAVLESVKGTRREYKLREILGKGLAAGGLAMLATSYSGAANAYSESNPKLSQEVNSVYIVSFWALLKWMKQARTKVAGLSFMAAS